MSSQLSLFQPREPEVRLTDREREELAKNVGMKQASERDPRIAKWLALARQAAVHVAKTDGTADMDRVRRYMDKAGWYYESGPWLGCVILPSDGWRKVGHTLQTYPGTRRREIKVWSL